MVSECFEQGKNGLGTPERIPLWNSCDLIAAALPERKEKLDMLPECILSYGDDVAKFEAVPLKLDPKRLEELAKSGKANKETIDAVKKIGESIGNLTFENGRLDKEKLEKLQDTIDEAAKNKKVDIGLVMKEIKGQFEAQANGKDAKFRIARNPDGTFDGKEGGFGLKLEMKLKNGTDIETYMEFLYNREPQNGRRHGSIGIETFVVPKKKLEF